MTRKELTILITARHGDDLIERVRRLAGDVRILGRGDLEKEPSLIGQVEIIYGGIKPEDFPRAARLKWLQSTGAGAGWTQRPEVLHHPAVITNARIHAEQISEHLFGMLLMLTRRLHEAYRNQLERLWQPPKGGEVLGLSGRTLCVLGLGAIGQRCTALGAAFGMRVIGVRRRPRPTEHVQRVFGPDELEQALRQGQAVMSLLPGTSATEKIIGRRQFAAMPGGAMFFNAGRGSTVDTEALVEALAGGKLAGAGLDVVDPEPLPAEHPLWGMPNVIISAHYSGGIADYHRRTERVFLDNLARYLAGLPLESVVDKQEGY